jgi:hypothetical protein
VLDGSVIGGRWPQQQTPHSHCVGGHDLVHCPVLPLFSVTGKEVWHMYEQARKWGREVCPSPGERASLDSSVQIKAFQYVEQNVIRESADSIFIFVLLSNPLSRMTSEHNCSILFYIKKNWIHLAGGVDWRQEGFSSDNVAALTLCICINPVLVYLSLEGIQGRHTTALNLHEVDNTKFFFVGKQKLSVYFRRN